MITTDHLEDVSSELCHLEDLLTTLDLVSDGLIRGELPHHKQAYDATRCVLQVARKQLDASHAALDVLFGMAREQKRGAA